MSETASEAAPPAAEPRVKRQYHKRKVVKRAAPVRTAAPPQQTAAPEQAMRQFEDEPTSRVRRDDRMVNNFPVPAYGRRPGRDYQWIALKVLGEPVTTPPLTEFYEGGWRPEKAATWPTLVDPGTPPDAAVDRMDQRLFSRPMQFTMEAKQEDWNAAEQQRRDRMMNAIEGRPVGGEGLAHIRGIEPKPLIVEISGEIGERAPMPRR